MVGVLRISLLRVSDILGRLRPRPMKCMTKQTFKHPSLKHKQIPDAGIKSFGSASQPTLTVSSPIEIALIHPKTTVNSMISVKTVCFWRGWISYLRINVTKGPRGEARLNRGIFKVQRANKQP